MMIMTIVMIVVIKLIDDNVPGHWRLEGRPLSWSAEVHQVSSYNISGLDNSVSGSGPPAPSPRPPSPSPPQCRGAGNRSISGLLMILFPVIAATETRQTPSWSLSPPSCPMCSNNSTSGCPHIHQMLRPFIKHNQYWGPLGQCVQISSFICSKLWCLSWMLWSQARY